MSIDMKGMNLSRWALTHQQMVGFLLVLAAVAGLFSYMALGRKEDPEFTVKTMMIPSAGPARPQQMSQQVIKPIETVLTENIAEIDYVKSKARPGQATLNVTLISTVKSSAVPDIWYRIRKTVTDHRATCPTGSSDRPSTTSSARPTAISMPSRATAFPIRCSNAMPRRCATVSRRCPMSPRRRSSARRMKPSMSPMTVRVSPCRAFLRRR
jgi:hypothetical protein